MATTNGINPLRPEDCDCLDKVIESTVQMREFLAKCQTCGLPIKEAINRNEEHAKLASEVKRQFFPERP